MAGSRDALRTLFSTMLNVGSAAGNAFILANVELFFTFLWVVIAPLTSSGIKIIRKPLAVLHIFFTLTFVRIFMSVIGCY